MNNNFFSDIRMKLDSIALIREDSDTVAGEDIIRVNVPAFLRIIELVREDIKDDVPLHYLTEILTRLSKTGVVTMEDYETVENYTMQDAKQSHSKEPDNDVYEAKKDRSPGKIDKDEDPCWSGYHMVGTKKKNGREVPNCVPGKKGS